MPVVLFCLFMRPGTKILATTTTRENLPVVHHVCILMEATSQPSLFLQEECLQTCQEILLRSPIGIVCQLRKKQMVPKCEVLLTLKNEKRSCNTENTK